MGIHTISNQWECPPHKQSIKWNIHPINNQSNGISTYKQSIKWNIHHINNINIQSINGNIHPINNQSNGISINLMKYPIKSIKWEYPPYKQSINGNNTLSTL